MNSKIPQDEQWCEVCEKLIPKSQVCCCECEEKGFAKTYTNNLNNVVQERTNKPIPRGI